MYAMDVVIAVVAAIVAARASLAAAKIYKPNDLVDNIYDWMRKYGDLVHIAYGIFVARLLDYARQVPPAGIAAGILATLYVVYQIVEDLEAPPAQRSAPKDIAVFTAAMTVTLATLWGIPVNIPVT